MKDPQTAPEKAVRALISRAGFLFTSSISLGAKSLVRAAVTIVSKRPHWLCAPRPSDQDYPSQAALSKNTKGRFAH